MARDLRPTNDTLTFSLETVEPVFSKAFGILVGLQSLGAGCDNNRWPLSLPSPSPPRSATHATPCLLTRSIRRSANLFCKHTESVKDDAPLTPRSLKPAFSLSMWPSMPHSHTSQCECGGPASEGAGQRFLQVHSVSVGDVSPSPLAWRRHPPYPTPHFLIADLP